MCVCVRECVYMWQRAGACRSAAPTSEQKNWRLLSTLVCTKVSSLKQLPPNKKNGERRRRNGEKIILIDYFMKLCPALHLTAAAISHARVLAHELKAAVRCLLFWLNLYLILCCSIKTQSCLLKALHNRSWRLASPPLWSIFVVCVWGGTLSRSSRDECAEKRDILEELPCTQTALLEKRKSVFFKLSLLSFFLFVFFFFCFLPLLAPPPPSCVIMKSER